MEEASSAMAAADQKGRGGPSQPKALKGPPGTGGAPAAKRARGIEDPSLMARFRCSRSRSLSHRRRRGQRGGKGGRRRRGRRRGGRRRRGRRGRRRGHRRKSG